MLIDDALGQHALTDERQERGFVGKCTVGHLEVKTAHHGVEAGVDRAPVAHQNALEAPLLAQLVAQQPAVLTGMHAVDHVIAAHHGAYLTALHGLAEGGEINLLHRALVGV